MRVDITVGGEKDGSRGTFELLFGSGRKNPTVDFADETPVVVWEKLMAAIGQAATAAVMQSVQPAK